jgi:hypothetical protein
MSQHDVVIVGGGTAGVAAAMAAGRNGADTILIERYGFLGGTMTAGLVNPHMTCYAGKEQIIHGIFQEMLDRLSEMNGYDAKTWTFDAEIMKIVLDQMVEEAGVELSLHTYLTDVIMKGKTICGVETYSKSGRRGVLGKIVVDATGDGDVAFLAGAPYEKGRKEDGLTQPMTLNFRMAGINLEKMPPMEEINRLYSEAKAKGEIGIPLNSVAIYNALRKEKGELHFNSTRVIKVDGTKSEDLTYAELEGRRQVHELVNFLKEKVPGFEDAYLLVSGTQIGIRETRRILGEYVLTGEDIVKARKFEDVIARGSFYIDIHNPTGKGKDYFKKAPPPGESYDIPYRCLVPKEVENLLVAGRCVSSTHEGHAAIRIIPIVMAMGQAAGTAAALSARLDVAPRELDVALLQKTLREQGANLGQSKEE